MISAELRKGDSGSWVIDAASNTILGYVVAISVGSAYLIPLFEQIGNALKPEKPVCIPSPFRMLLNLARHHFAIEADGNRNLSEHYVSEALSPEVLDMRSSDQFILLVRAAIQEGVNERLLKRLLCSTGADLWSILVSFSTWWPEHQHEIEQDLIPILNQLQQLLARFSAVSEITAAPNSAEAQDTEKGEKLTGKQHFR